ncbi:hypothetical protein BDZ45DRAFT_781971 [Acephala macrosclerotiorum]|nr:hypothetical protein BDZ45DRAFT_781971 [Acephala macrosclerotiorum]
MHPFKGHGISGAVYWSFTDPGPTRSAFSNMTSSLRNRQQFITGSLAFMNHYSFDGVDLDWEYPQVDDRGGVTADMENYVSLVTELQAALGTKYGISMTLPTSYCVDWFNFMTYDLHGVWDAASLFLGPYINPHTNVTEIDMGLDLLWRAGVEPAQVNLGLACYGRSFTLSDPSCSTPNGVCQFTGGANAGPCTDASGILGLEEIENIISTNSLTPVWDKTAAAKWITWDSNQWVSYDDDDTFQQKRTFANSRCLGGTMIWAIDQRNQTADNGLAAAPGITTQNQVDAKHMSDNLAAGVTCYTTDCNVDCKTGTNEVTQMDGQPNQLSTNGRYGATMGTCQWRGYHGMGLSCMGGCADGETEIACTGGTQSYCCKGFTPAPSGSDLQTQAEDAAKAAAEAVAEQAALDIAAKAFCRLAVPALLAPLELLEDVIPFIGEILDIAEIAATPALINLCVKDVEKEGQAEFKVFGKEHTLSMDKLTAIKESRPIESSHSTPSTSSCGNSAKRADNNGCLIYGQACYNYRSIANLDDSFATLTCAYHRVANTQRPISKTYVQQHKTTLWDRLIANVPQGPPAGCSPDEFPPAVTADINDGYSSIESTTSMAPRVPADRGQRIRYLAAAENEPAGKIFNKCGGGPEWTLDNPLESVTAPGRRAIETTYTKYRAVYTRSRFTMNFAGLDNPADDGIPKNPCIPTANAVWFNAAANAAEKLYTVNYARPWPMIGGNSSPVASPEELRREFGFDSCSDDSCSRELRALRAVSETVREDSLPPTKPSSVNAEATPISVNESVIVREEPILISLPGSNSIDAEFPTDTGKAASMPKKFPKFSRGRGKH